ncbi:MAG: hypothetical protein R3E66_14900 [bacterium]
MRRLLPLLLLLGLMTGCIGAQKVVRTEQQTPVVSVFVLQYPDRPEIDAVPASYQNRITDEVRRRNLLVQIPPSEDLFKEFRTRRGTDQRVKTLREKHPGQFIMLVESEVRFYSFLSGKFRWNVAGRVTFSQPDGDVQTTPFELAAFLDFDHQNEADALRYVELAVAERIGQATDRFLSGIDGVNVVLPQ